MRIKRLLKLATILTVMAATLAGGQLGAGAVDLNPVDPAARQIYWSQPEYPDEGQPITDGKFHLDYSFNGGAGAFAAATNFTATNPITREMVFCDVVANCKQTGFSQIMAFGIFQFCAATNQAPCIEGFQYKLQDGDWADAKFLGTADPSPTSEQARKAYNSFGSMEVTSILSHTGWDANIIPGMPGSATGPHIFELPGAINSGGTDIYTLSPGYMATAQNTDGTISNLSIADFSVTVIPTVVDTKQFGAAILGMAKAQNGGNFNFGSTLGIGDAAGASYVDQHSVGFAAQFPKGLTLRLSLRLNTALGGWYQGRLDSPSVQVTNLNRGENQVILEAQPTVVPVTSVTLDPFDADKKQALTALKNLSGNGPQWDTWAGQDKGTGGYTRYAWASFQGLQPFDALGKYLDPKAKGFASAFEFKRLTDNNQCMSDNTSFQGLLTTNAMVYQSELPTFDSGLISYKVGGVHYDVNGEVFKGTYNFIMRDSVAKCLYGFKGTAPMQGSISVTSSDGQENVAYTNVSDRDGWLKLTAQGFTFSNPVIKAKLTQADDPATKGSTGSAGSSGSNAGGSSVAKKVTITCVKGKTVKKVTAVSPKCPAGYKKK